MTQDDYEYMAGWITDGHFDNGDYTRLFPLLNELLFKGGRLVLADTRSALDGTGWSSEIEDDETEGDDND